MAHRPSPRERYSDNGSQGREVRADEGGGYEIDKLPKRIARALLVKAHRAAAMVITQEILDELSSQAKANPRWGEGLLSHFTRNHRHLLALQKVSG